MGGPQGSNSPGVYLHMVHMYTALMVLHPFEVTQCCEQVASHLLHLLLLSACNLADEIQENTAHTHAHSETTEPPL